MIGTAARLTHWKGQEVALRAARELQRRGVAFRWMFAGDEALGAPGYRDHLLELIRAWDLGREVELLGWVGDMAGFYRTLDVLVHVPIEPEPYGLVLAEALASGLAVVATPGGADGIVAAAGGAIVPAGRPEAVAAALIELAERPNVLASKQAQARQVAEHVFDTRRYAEELAAIYESLIDRGHPIAHMVE
jgi:glycosyltransferase involved in cell wall biosynthesis